MEKEPCQNCRSLTYTRSTVWREKGVRYMTCEDCSKQQRAGFSDAEGNKITYIPTDGIWPSLGVPINSARELSEHAKRHNLRQVGEIRGKSC